MTSRTTQFHLCMYIEVCCKHGGHPRPRSGKDTSLPTDEDERCPETCILHAGMAELVARTLARPGRSQDIPSDMPGPSAQDAALHKAPMGAKSTITSGSCAAPALCFAGCDSLPAVVVAVCTRMGATWACLTHDWDVGSLNSPL